MLSTATGITDRQWAYLESASVLAYFDLAGLRPLGIERGDDPFEPAFITDYSNLMVDASGRRVWTLAQAIRRRALERLVSSSRLQEALGANPLSGTDKSPLQRMLRSYLEGNARPYSEQSVDELRATLVISEWLGGDSRLASLPPLEEIRKQIDFANFLTLFRELAGENFVGRSKELADIETHLLPVELPVVPNIGLGTLSPAPVSTGPLRVPPLVFYGPGGIGKSAILASFLLKHATLDPSKRYPIVYLDFDRSVLDPDEPVTFLLDAFDQIAVYFPELRSSADKYHDEWIEQMANPNFREDRSSTGERSSAWRFRLRDRSWFTESFARFVASVPFEGRPLLFILDTFEEAQFRSRVLVEDTLALLYDLQSRIPRFRAVVSGRTEVVFSKYPCKNIPVDVLDVEAAADYLVKTTKLGHAVAKLLVQQVDRSPLVLRLAALLVSTGGTPVEGGGRAMFARFRAKLLGKSIESQLYGRFLDHIHDPEVGKIAHPGLILRLITPRLILEVLAGHCGVVVKDLEAAEDLLNRMRREGTLVIDVAPGVVEHRPDLRRLMLEDMRADKKTDVEDLHRLAVSYYERHPSEHDARAEELYHRLMLVPFDRTAIDSRWDDVAVRSLGTTIEEMPKPAQAYVAARLEWEGFDPSIWVEADQIDWEKHAGQVSRRYLEGGKYDSALTSVRERKRRLPGSELNIIEADALMLLGRASDALPLVEAALDYALMNRISGASRDGLWARRDMLLSLAGPSKLQFNGAQVAQVTEALVDSFSRQEFEGVLRTGFGRELSEFAVKGEAYRQTVLAVVVRANSESWARELIATARRENPTNPKLAEVGATAGAGTVIQQSDIQQTAESSGRFTDAASFSRILGKLEGCVARLDITESGFTSSATGFLIAPDVVLTTFHVLERAIGRYLESKDHYAPDVVVRFDIEATGRQVVRSGVENRLADDWLLQFSPAPESRWDNASEKLDFAFLHLRGGPGFDTRSGGIPRGWIDLPPEPVAVHPGDDILVLGYPSGEGLKLTTAQKGIVGVSATGDFLYDAAVTEIGSSGAPCFNRDLELIGMRRAVDRLGDRFESVTAASIVSTLKKRGVEFGSWPYVGGIGSGATRATVGTFVAGKDLSDIVEAFSHAFTLPELESLVSTLDRKLSDYVPLNAPADETFRMLISAAQRQSWIDSLIRKAREMRPDNAALHQVSPLS